MVSRLLAAFAVLLTLAVLPAPGTANDHITIQPGGQVNGICTLNFVYDGTGPRAGDVYIGTASHCVSGIGERMRVNGVAFGTVAYRGDPGEWATDYALILVDEAMEDNVVAAVRGHPTWPSGHTVASETTIGDLVGYSGWGLGFSTTAITREQRVGVVQSDNTREYSVQGPEIFGDSGGPIVHVETGKAYGIVSGATLVPYVNRGPTVEGILSDAAQNGFPVTVRTV